MLVAMLLFSINASFSSNKLFFLSLYQSLLLSYVVLMCLKLLRLPLVHESIINIVPVFLTPSCDVCALPSR